MSTIRGEGPVGAKLQLRFPDLEVGMDRANAADQQTDRQGDFQIGTTAFHVTVSPMQKLIDRCRENIRDGYRPVIVTSSDRVAAARQLAEVGEIGDQVQVAAVEDWVGTNIEEISQYEGNHIRCGVALLIRTYNVRITEIEVDQSLRIDEPEWVKTLLDDH
ncbi:DUF4928 family protein [Cutibacterium avidum]|uniref:DUF4928 family protein n=1 Tax=Cutibacterium avidum TaxID=33010 RepID=UPI00080FC688|nr:DUF4928 family protein [Cutibacterium avidum]OCK13735.1 DUF4928 domain-containing protein [Cutibacterium avidum]